MSGIVEFNLSDGFTPQQMNKLNQNFRRLSGMNPDNVLKSSHEEENSNDLYTLAEAARIAASNASQYARRALAYLLDIEDDWAAIQEYEDMSRDRLIDIIQTANKAADSAEEAERLATQASIEAYSANQYALAAGYSLGELQQVIGNLDWAMQHGTFVAATEDYDSRKPYYVPDPLSPSGYSILSETSEEDMYDYSLTEDQAVVASKTYYIIIGSGTEDDPYRYSAVANPIDADLPTYYERTANYYVLDLSESIQNYLASHLWMDDYGLNLTVATDGQYQGYRIHEGTIDGHHPLGMYVLDAYGTSVAKFGEETQIGSDTGAHVSIVGNQLAFMVGNQQVAYISVDPVRLKSVFHITSAIIVEDLRFGKWQFKSREKNDNLTLMWFGAEQSS